MENTNMQINNQIDNEIGKGPAIASLVLGIVGIVFWFFGWLSIVSVVCGIIGIVLSIVSKKKGYRGGIKTAGLVLSILSLVFGSLVFIACVACMGGFVSAMSQPIGQSANKIGEGAVDIVTSSQTY